MRRCQVAGNVDVSLVCPGPVLSGFAQSRAVGATATGDAKYSTWMATERCAALMAAARGVGYGEGERSLSYWASHEVLFAQSMALGNVYVIILLDGPRTALLKGAKTTRDFRATFFGETAADEEEMYPYDLSDRRVRWQWRARIALYFTLRGVAVAAGWV